MAHALKSTFRTTLYMSVSDGSEEELTLTLDYEFTPGTSESGRYGPPEHYDPGSDPELYIDRMTLLRNQEPVHVPEWMKGVICSEALKNAIISEANEKLEGERDQAMEHRAEMVAEMAAERAAEHRAH